MSRSSSAQLLLRPNCKPQMLEWHVQPLDSAATDPTAPATLQSAFDWCFQHQTFCRQTHSSQHPIKLLRNPCQMHPADSSWSIFWFIYTAAPLLFTPEPPGSPWPVFAAWPAAHSRRLEHLQPGVKQQHPKLSCQNHKIPPQQRAGLQCVSPRCCILVWGIL